VTQFVWFLFKNNHLNIEVQYQYLPDVKLNVILSELSVPFD